LKKLDLRKELKRFYNPPVREMELVELPSMNFIMIDGRGDPNTSEAYRESIEALYNLSYTLKFAIKREEGIDYPVMALEGLWSTPEGKPFTMTDRESWLWTSMILQPPCVTERWFRRAVEIVKAKKELPSLKLARLEEFAEGLSAQTLHTGPYSAEAPTILRLHSFIEANGYVPRGRHHEIYLGDPRRAAPDKLRTIIRQPVSLKRGAKAMGSSELP
jgi:hypothetical protein